MAAYLVHLMGHRHPIEVELPFSGIEALMSKASHSRFIIGHFMAENGDGMCRRLMISTSRLECVLEMG